MSYIVPGKGRGSSRRLVSMKLLHQLHYILQRVFFCKIPDAVLELAQATRLHSVSFRGRGFDRLRHF